MKILSYEEVNNYLYKVILELSHIVSVQKEYELSNELCNEIMTNFVPKLRHANISFDNKFVLDVLLYQYTALTRLGDSKAHMIVVEFNKELNKVGDLLIKLNYYIMFHNRRSIDLINAFKFQESLKVLNNLIQASEDFLSMLEMIDDNNLNTINKFEQLGKLYGSRGQVFTRLIEYDKTNLHKAEEDFNSALQHFSKKRDRDRQYVYLANLYSEVGETEKALSYLLQCEEFNVVSEENITKCCSKWATNYLLHIFKFNILMKIIANTEDKKYSQQNLLKIINRSSYDIPQMIKELQDKTIYPLPIILYHNAKINYDLHNKRKAKNYIQQAITMLNSRLESNTLLKTIELALCSWKDIFIQGQSLSPVTQNKLNNFYNMLVTSDNNKLIDYTGLKDVVLNKENREAIIYFINTSVKI